MEIPTAKFLKTRMFLIISLGVAISVTTLLGCGKSRANSQEVVASTNKQIENLRQDLIQAKDHWAHINLGQDYEKVRNYEAAAEEYKKAIEVIQDSPGYQGGANPTLDDLKMNEKIRIDTQIFPRHELAEVYEKAGRYQEAIEQIDWLLEHKPLEHVKVQLLAKKDELLQKVSL